jgi:hypothetical protein
MKFKDAFDEFGNRRVFSKPDTAHRVVGVLLLVGFIVALAVATEGFTS